MAVDVHELIDLTEAELDPENFTVDVRLIRAGWSANDRYYGDGVLSEAAKLWEGVKAYADHPGRQERRNRPERSVRDIVGKYTNVRHESGVTRAKMHIIGEARQWAWPLIVETVESGTPLIGLSINALGTGAKGEAEGRKGLVVEAITHANSVDMVTEPAAGGGFERLLASDDGWSKAVIEELELDELREARPDIIADLKREWKSTRDTKAVKDARAQAEAKADELANLTEEHRTIQAALQEAQARLAQLEKERLVDRLLAGKQMPDEVRRELREELLQADDEAAMLESVERTLKVLGAVRLPVRVTEAGRARQPQSGVPGIPRRNPAAEVFGVNPELVEAETFDEYLHKRQQLTGAK